MKQAGAVVAVLAVMAAGACAADHEEQPMRPNTTVDERPSGADGADGGDRATDPAEPIADLVADADLIVTGSVVDVAPDAGDTGTFPAQTATIDVETVLKGDARPGELTIAKPESAYFLVPAAAAPDDRKARFGGVFVLKTTGDGTPTLLGHVGVHDHEFAPQWFARVLAGLPAKLPPPTSDQLADWMARADVIVFAGATGDGDKVETHTPRLDWTATGTLAPIEVLKGELPGAVDVVRGPQPALPGGTWAFPVQKERTGVFFLDTSGGSPVVINTAAPWDVAAQEVRRLLGG